QSREAERAAQKQKPGHHSSSHSQQSVTGYYFPAIQSSRQTYEHLFQNVYRNLLQPAASNYPPSREYTDYLMYEKKFDSMSRKYYNHLMAPEKDQPRRHQPDGEEFELLEQYRRYFSK